MCDRVKQRKTWYLTAILVIVMFLPGLVQAVEKQPPTPAPAFDLSDGKNARVTLESLRGKVVYLDFWASWCPPCRKSFPWMAEMQDKYKSQGLAVVAVGMDMDISLAREFLDSQRINFRIGYDLD